MSFSQRSQTPIPSPWLTLKTDCEICGIKRSQGNHRACSEARKAKFAKENAK